MPKKMEKEGSVRPNVTNQIRRRQIRKLLFQASEWCCFWVRETLRMGQIRQIDTIPCNNLIFQLKYLSRQKLLPFSLHPNLNSLDHNLILTFRYKYPRMLNFHVLEILNEFFEGIQKDC